MLSCSFPAFEGAHIRAGMRAARAIERIRSAMARARHQIRQWHLRFRILDAFTDAFGGNS
jgi:uncharacterized 2Fe-2S/4Fe-4S cluster protein (DUF4445 family)